MALVRHPLACGVALAFAVASAARAHADPAARTDEADTLFDEGRQLMDSGNLANACAKFERSFQLAPRLGTMLNLGGCFEKQNKLARALALYERAVTLARQLGRPDREAAAREFAAALESRVAKLVVVLQDSSMEIVAQIDGETISTHTGLIPLDPGKRRLTAFTPGRVPFETTLELAAGKTTTVTIPKLNDSPRPVPAVVAPARTGSSSLRTSVVVVGLGVTALGIGAGTFFGLRAKARRDDSNAQCDATGCSPEGLTRIDEARFAGNVSSLCFAVAGAGFATSLAVLIFTPSRASTTVRLSAWPGGASLTGAFR